MSLLSVVLATETEIVSAFMLPETAVSRSCIAAVVIDRLSIISACARRCAAGGGTLMTFSAVSLPRDTANRPSVDAHIRAIDGSWRCAVLERF